MTTDQLTNLFAMSPAPPGDGEHFELLVETPGCRIERILSAGQTTPAGEWYDQATDEWVALLQGEAELSFADGSRRRLRAGDHLFIPAHLHHRVEHTSSQPPCIWVAVHCRAASK